MAEFSIDDVAKHRSKSDLWITINGKVYDVSKYLRDHPGGADALLDVAGGDATSAYEDVGHSEDADEILQGLLIGSLKGGARLERPAAVRLIQGTPPKGETTNKLAGGRFWKAAVSSLGGALLLYLASSTANSRFNLRNLLKTATHIYIPSLKGFTEQFPSRPGFGSGVLVSFAFCSVLCSAIGSRLLSTITHIESGFTKFPPHIKRSTILTPNPHFMTGFLHPKEYKSLVLVVKDLLAPNTYRFVFQLPAPDAVIGLPIGQHVAIRANIGGKPVSRSYTPTSNNLDLGRLELVIKCYPDGLLTGKYLANLRLGDKVQFRGPKGAMRYEKGLCRRIGMIAGGTGITPMYQLIRAICEDEMDTTEISLIYANRSEEDILLRKDLERFAALYPKSFKIWYMLDHPPQKWRYGKGYVTAEVMTENLPVSSPDTMILLCGPPGMVNASKKTLVSLGYQNPGSVSKMGDQIFSF